MSELTEFVCEDCMDGDHEACRREGGWPFQDTNERCGCHLTDHRLDNRTDRKRGMDECGAVLRAGLAITRTIRDCTPPGEDQDQTCGLPFDHAGPHQSDWVEWDTDADPEGGS